jgi:hypothetical protein
MTVVSCKLPKKLAAKLERVAKEERRSKQALMETSGLIGKRFIAILMAFACGSMLQAQFPSDSPAPQSLTIQAYVDGPSELHVKVDGIYWINGENAKPGLHDGAKFPTYVNGEAWFPLWHKQRKDRGVDQSFLHVISSPSLDFDCKLISVGTTKEYTGIVPRTPIQAEVEAGEYVVHIPDPEPGAMWYKFVLTPRMGGN